MVYAFNYDVWGLPIVEAKSLRKLAAKLGTTHCKIRRWAERKQRDKKTMLKFVAINEKQDKKEVEEVKTVVCYLVYDCKIEGEPTVYIADTMQEVADYLGCWESSVRHLIKYDKVNRQGLKVARVEFEDD